MTAVVSIVELVVRCDVGWWTRPHVSLVRYSIILVGSSGSVFEIGTGFAVATLAFAGTMPSIFKAMVLVFVMSRRISVSMDVCQISKLGPLIAFS